MQTVERIQKEEPKTVAFYGRFHGFSFIMIENYAQLCSRYKGYQFESINLIEYSFQSSLKVSRNLLNS